MFLAGPTTALALRAYTQVKSGQRSPSLDSYSDDALVRLIRAARDVKSGSVDQMPAHESSAVDKRQVVELGGRAWTVLFQRYRHCIDRVARQYRLPTKGAGVRGLSADDFAHDVYEQFRNDWRAASYKGTGSFEAWFLTVLRRFLIDLLRAAKKEVPSRSASDNSEGRRARERETESPTTSSSVSVLRRGIDALPPTLRSAFVLAHLDTVDPSPEDLAVIAAESGRTLNDILDHVRALERDVVLPQVQRVKRDQDRLAEMHSRLLDLHTSIAKLEEQEEILQQAPSSARVLSGVLAELERLRHRAAELLNRQEKLRQELTKVVRVRSHHVARVLKTSAENVDQRLSRARRLLRQVLESEERDG